ncbi:MAG: AsmA family protein [Deferribacterota bacterium]|nr:AsmA family protein [Deferribacterota bacterium]
MKILKYFGISLLILLICIVLLIVGFVYFFDLSKYRDSIESKLSETLHRKVEIEGDLSLSFYPLFSFNIEDLSIYNPKSFENDIFASLGRINLSLNIVRLLKDREIVVKSLLIESPEIKLAVLKDGSNNWSDLSKNLTAGDSKQKEETKKSKEEESIDITSFSIDTIKLSNGTIMYNDYKNDTRYAAKIKDLNIYDFGVNKKMHYTSNINTEFNENKLNLLLEGEIFKKDNLINLTNNRLTFKDIQVGGNDFDDVNISFDGNINIKEPLIKLDNIDIKYEDVTIKADLNVESSEKTYTAISNIDIKGSFKEKSFNIKGKINYKGNLASISGLNINLLNTTATGSAELLLADQVSLNYKLNINKLDLNKLKKALQLEDKKKDEKETKKPLEVNNYRESFAKLQGINLDKININGSLNIDKLLFNNLDINNIFNKTILDKGKFRDELSFSLNNIEHNLSIDLYKKDSKLYNLDVNIDAENLNISQFFNKDLYNVRFLQKPSLLLKFSANKESININKLLFQGRVNNKYPFLANLNGSLNIKDKSIDIAVSNLKFNRSNLSGFLNTKIDSVFNDLRGHVETLVDVNDIAFFMGSDTDAIEKRGIRDISFEGDYKLNLLKKSLDLDKLDINFKNSKIKGSLFTEFNNNNCMIKSSINSNLINLDDFMALYSIFKKEDVKGNLSSEKKVTNNKEVGTLQLCKKNKITLEANIDKLILKDLVLNSVSVDGDGEENKYSFNLESQLYNGLLESKLNIDTGNSMPYFTLKGSASSVNIDPLLIDLFEDSFLTGSANMDITLNTKGMDTDSMLKYAKGDIRLNVVNGMIKGINIGLIVRNIFSLIERERLTLNKDVQDFAEMNAHLNINDGKITNNNLLIHSPFFNIKGDGYLDILKKYIDYTIYLSLLRPAFEKTVDNRTSQHDNIKEDVIYEAITEKPIPIRYRGPLFNPKEEIDYKAFVKKNLGDIIKKNLAPVKEKVDKFLRDLF